MVNEIKKITVTVTVKENDLLPDDYNVDLVMADFTKVIEKAVNRYYEKNPDLLACGPDVI